MSGGAVAVIAWGIGASVRNGGRPGLAHLGRSRGGAIDLAALELANRLVGNDPHAAAVETSGGTALRFERAAVVAIAGGVPEVVVDRGPPVGWGIASALRGGTVLRIGRVHDGVRAYVAVRGGIRESGGDRLATGPEPAAPPSGVAAAPRLPRGVVRIWPGPRLDWFEDGAWAILGGSAYTASTEASRVGVRLDGPALRRSRPGELPSEGMVEGAVQVPPDGRPIVMLADHPVTGGYPVVAVVDPDDLAIVAQASPGTELRFRPVRRPTRPSGATRPHPT